MTALTGTECNIVYLTDEEEFMDTITIKTCKNVTKPSKSSGQKRQKSRGYNLAYLNLWWSRMTRDAQREEKEMKEQEEEVKKKMRCRKWFKQSKQDVENDECSDKTQCSSQQSILNLCQATISNGEGGIFKGANYQGVRVGEGVVTENDCAINEWSQAEVRMNVQLKNTPKSRVIIMATESKTAESEVGGGEIESESDNNLMSRCEL